MSNIYKDVCIMIFAISVFVFVMDKFINYDGNILINVIVCSVLLLSYILCLLFILDNSNKEDDLNEN